MYKHAFDIVTCIEHAIDIVACIKHAVDILTCIKHAQYCQTDIDILCTALIEKDYIKKFEP